MRTPPENARGAAPGRTAPTRTDAAAKQNVTTKPTPGAGHEPEALRRRRHATGRCEPLPCGCRDPWPCPHTMPARYEDHELDAYLAAAAYLARLGLPALVPASVRTALDLRAARRRFLAAGGRS